jgi:DNA repair ATPase RecN
MQPSRWWKCDLQVATPAWEFTLPAGQSFDFEDKAGRATFLDLYMAKLKERGIEVIALADHNSAEWIDDVVAAGKKHQIVVFPGCEITSHTGSDGVHLIVIGDTNRTTQDFDRLIHGPLGFDSHKHMPFRDEGDSRLPSTSSKSVIQILDSLPEDYLVVAPHVLNDNGLVSGKTVKGDIRWKSFHHPRLAAVDPGDCSDVEADSFNSAFRGRRLDNFPRLKTIAFVATSDAYDLDSLGRRYCWVRMAEPSIEGLRQAFLDHESRIICDWSSKLNDFPDRIPNLIRHGWITSLELGGRLGNSRTPFRFPLHPGLNVIIGGRGSGKSTVVAAIRQLFSSMDSLPARLRGDLEGFVGAVFPHATLSAHYALPESQQELQAIWQKDSGSVSMVKTDRLRTDFPVTVISQKELFERASGDKDDPFLPSRSLLSLLDEHIGLGATEAEKVGSWHRRIEDARSEWAQATRSYLELTKDVGQIKQLREQITTVQTQVNAFAAPEVKARLARIDARRAERLFLQEREQRLRQLIERFQAILPAEVAGATGEPEDSSAPETLGEFRENFIRLVTSLHDIEVALTSTVAKAVVSASGAVAELEADSSSPWKKDADAAEEDLKLYTAELKGKGLSPDEFGKLQDKLRKTREIVKELEAKEKLLPDMKQRVANATAAVKTLLSERRERRTEVLTSIERRSGRLRFVVAPFSDSTRWQESMRELCGFRADAFQGDVSGLANALWSGDAEEREQKWSHWRTALATGAFSKWQEEFKGRPAFIQRLSTLDEAIRHRLATEVPDDVVTMYFLRDGGSPGNDSDWQPISEGSPGQRTAAMLAFVLHHGHEPLVLDQPEDDLDSEWISKLVVRELRASRWRRQLIVVSHNANIPVLGDADQVITLENRGADLAVRESDVGSETDPVPHIGPVEYGFVRRDIQNIMEGGVVAFIQREQKYHIETNPLRVPN